MDSQIILNVPYYSQFKDVATEEFKPKGKGRACIATCLKMALEYTKSESVPSIDKLFTEGLLIAEDMIKKNLITTNATIHGLPHDIVVFLSHNYGVPAYKEEFKSNKTDLSEKTFSTNDEYSSQIFDYGIEKLKKVIKNNGVVIVSVIPGFAGNEDMHSVLLVGTEDGEKDGFYYHNPDDRIAAGANQYISMPDFKKSWRKMAIFFEK